MKRLVVLVAALAFGSVAQAELKTGQKAADFSTKSLAGQSVKLSALHGKVVLVDFWASWCEPCKKELPLLDKLAPRLRAKGIEIVAVNIDDNKAAAEAFVHAHGLNQLTIVSDADKSIVGAYEPPKMPSSFAVDSTGVVRAINAGFDTGDEVKIEAELTKLAK